ncbi:hypothetical protein M1770_03215 [Spiroplasma citri]|uniref:hypothetical protein n=1 Tax=Spiroplasma citri TaxID=2133 RepID=UPI002412DA8A|nr:hypothetical protein [Spiroplasma citri]WFG98981.1 hypothetical protein M1770_03215 [Spiroplasma citri]
MVINNKNCSYVIDNSDTTVFISGNPKKSYLFPLFITEWKQIFFIRMTSIFPKSDEKNYVEILNWNEIEKLKKTTYIRFDKNKNDIHSKWEYKIKKYEYIYDEKIEQYREEILRKALKCIYIQPIYYKYINEELEKIKK